MNVTKLFKIYFDDNLSITESSREIYISQTRKFVTHFGERDPKTITQREIHDQVIEAGKNIKGITMMNRNIMIWAFFKWLAATKRIARNPLTISTMPCKPVVPASKPVMTFEQYQKFRDLAMTKYGEETHGVIVIGWHTGLRLSDCCKFRNEWFNPEERVIRLVPQKVKRLNKEIEIPVFDELFDVLTKFRSDDDYLFVQAPYAVPAMSDRFRHLNESLKIQKGVTFHSTRHAMVSDLVNSGTSSLVIKTMTGQSLKTIEGYAKITPEARREAMMKARPGVCAIRPA